MSQGDSALQQGCEDGVSWPHPRLLGPLQQAIEIDPVERTVSFGRWWLDAETGQLVLSTVAAGLLDTQPGLHAEFESCFSQIVPDDVLTLLNAMHKLRTQEIVVDSVVRVINELDGVRWLRIVSLPRDRAAPGIRRGMLINVTAAQHATMRERLGFESTQFLLGANSLSDAISKVIKAVCEHLGWDWGAYWSAEQDDDGNTRLTCQHYWHNAGVALTAFTQETCAYPALPGKGLVGRVWATGRPAWVDTALTETGCLRGKTIRDSGLRSGYAFPVSYLTADGQREIPGVLEFCSHLPRQREAQLPNLSKAIGALVAQTIQRIEQTETIRRMALFDAMTGLANRSHFHQLLSQACADAAVAHTSFGVMFIDLDRFKPINDAYGHDAGNLVLQEFARRMQELAPKGSHVGRLGGDEFAILTPYDSHGEIGALAERLLVAAGMPYLFGDTELAVSASIGISVYPENGTSTPELLRSADAAMYRSKHDGRNGYAFYQGPSPTQPAVAQQISMEADLYHALLDDEFFLEYQPVFDSFGENIVAVEALIRWRRENGEIVRPDVFIPVAERSRLIVRIGQWVLRQACEDLAVFHRAGFSDLQVNVNMAVDEFTRDTLPDELTGIIRETGVQPRDVCLELTEGTVMRHADRVVPIMRALRQIGFHISLDDFGMGHSSLSRLKTLPITSLKIDRAFVSGIPGDKGDCSIVRTIFDLGKNMKLQVIAEGVETDAQFGFLQQFGYPMMQGFLLARPMPADQIINTYRRNSNG